MVGSKGQAGVDDTEIEVTPEMIEAGVDAMLDGFPRKGEPDDFCDIVANVYRAMETARLSRR